MAPGELISNFKNAFANYTNTFKSAPYNEDPSIERTIQHTERVVENILVLARSLDLTENELHIAEIAARFHDIGRLWLILPENSETKITDHAEASIEYLNTNSTFRELDESAQSIILNVIRNHNKPDLPKKEGESVLFYVKLLRDADKLDIYFGASLGSGVAIAYYSEFSRVVPMAFGGVHLGVRYYFTPKVGINGELGWGKSIVNAGFVFKM